MADPVFDLSGRTAIVTGAGRGIGRAIAQRMAALGASIVLTSRSGDQIEETQAAIALSGGKSIAITADIAQESAVRKVIDAARSQFGRIDYLVNNAGQVAVGTIAQLGIDDFDRMLAVNVRAMFLCSRAVWNDLAESRGAIINISSMSAFDPFPGLGAYGASKSFVNCYTRVLADEGAPLGIRAYAIAPGAVETDMLRGAFPEFPADQALSPDAVADLAVTLLSSACRYSSGQVVTIQKR